MSDESSAGLSLIARQQRRFPKPAGMQDGPAVTMAALQRLDSAAAELVNEVRAMHPQHARPMKRVSDLETNPQQPG